MPLTSAHAAAAWPIARAAPRLPVAALVLGTFAPDFEYLLRLRPAGNFGHTPLGILVFSVPLALCTWLGYTAFVRPAVLGLLPPGVRSEVARDIATRTAKRWPKLLYAALAALLGTLSHVGWDAFTHFDGWGVAWFPALGAPVPGMALLWCELLQHASTLLGSVALAAWLMQLVRRFPPPLRRYPPGEGRRAVATLAALLLVAAACAVLNGARAAGTELEHVLAYAAVGAMAGFASAVGFYAIVRHLRAM